MTPLRAALSKLPLPALLLIILGLAVCDFALAAGAWWITHQMAWWTLSLTWTVGSVCWWFTKAIVGVARDHRRKR